MKFKYKRYDAKHLRPVIPIEILGKNVSVPYFVRVDSGADMCIFDAELCEILGIEINKGDKSELNGATGEVQEFYIHPLIIKVGKIKYKVKVGFLPNLVRNGYGIVGQKGFFDQFIVKFDLKKESIDLIKRAYN